MPNVSLTPELQRFAESCVQSGRYGSLSEVARAGLRLLQDAEARRSQFLDMLAAAEAEGEAEGFADTATLAAELDRVIAESAHAAA